MTDDTNDAADSETIDPSEATPQNVAARTPGKGRTPTERPIEPAAPEEFGLVQAWWGDGKGKTTAAMGMGFRAAGHGYRVHMLQFMKAGASSVEDVRGEYNAIAAVPGFTYENSGHYGWHGFRDGSDEDDHAARARGGLERARELIAGARNADLTSPISIDAPAQDGVHMLVLDEILYAANRDLVSPSGVVDLIRSKPENLELILTGGHEKPGFVDEYADLVTNVRKEKHPFDVGHPARKGTEF